MQNFEDDFIGFQEHMTKIKHLRRTGWVDREVFMAETVASHSWRMAMMALNLEDKLKTMGLDVDKIVEICLLHDAGEALIGDIKPEEYQEGNNIVSNANKKELERNAVEKLAKDYNFPKILECFNDYDNQTSLEAKFAKELDKLDMILQAYEYQLTNPRLERLKEFLPNSLKYIKTSFVKDIVDEIAKRQSGQRVGENEEINKFLDFQMLCGNLKHLERAGPKMYNIPDCETVAAHSYRSAVMALQLDQHNKHLGIKTADVVRICLVHDIGEAVVGDIVPEKWQVGDKKISSKEKKKMEVAAVAWIAKEFDVPFVWKGFRDFEKRDTKAAIIAKDIEIYESIQQAYEYIKIYPEKAILQEYIPFHQPRIKNECINRIIDRLAIKQKKYLNKDGLMSFYENASKTKC